MRILLIIIILTMLTGCVECCDDVRERNGGKIPAGVICSEGC